MSNYKYLFWDIDGTVLNFLAAEKAAIKNLFLKYGFGECTDEMISRYSAINVKYWQALERKEMTKPEILVGRFREFFNGEGLDASRAESFNSDYQIALGDTIVFCDDAKNILLSEKDKFVLAAITNGTAIAQEKKLTKSGLKDIFDYIFISEEVGYEKPDHRFFETAISTIQKCEMNNAGKCNAEKDMATDDIDNIDISNILIIGDSLTSDILGGLNMGIDTCWYNPNHKPVNSDINPKYIISDLHELDSILQAKTD